MCFIPGEVLGVDAPRSVSKVCEFLSSETHLALGLGVSDRGPVFLFMATSYFCQYLNVYKVR